MNIMTMMALFTNNGVIPAPETRILKADEYRTLVAADALIATAREQAASMMAQAEKDAEERRKQGYEEGLLEGKAEVAERLFETMTASVEHLSAMESTIVDLVIKSLKTVLGNFDREELAVATVNHALRLVRDEKRVLLRVAVADADAVAKYIEDIVLRYPGMGRVDVVPDAGLKPGGCVMETEIGVIDATLTRQLALIEESFRRQLEERRG